METLEDIGAFLAVMALNAIGILAAGAMFMVAVELAHDSWIHQLPSIGYWTATLIVFLLRAAIAVIRIGDMGDEKS